MKKLLLTIFPVMLIALLSACNGQKKTDKAIIEYDTVPATQITIAAEYYFEGDFSYMADAAVLKDAATGINIPVAMREAFPKAEKEYLTFDMKGAPVYACLKGYLAQKGKDEEGPDRQLVITNVLSMKKNAKTSASRLIVGNYNTADQTLTIAPDYTYKLVSKGGEAESGKWNLANEDTMICASGNNTTLIKIDYAKGELIIADEDMPLVFKKLVE